jgi:hypothetical protein
VNDAFNAPFYMSLLQALETSPICDQLGKMASLLGKKTETRTFRRRDVLAFPVEKSPVFRAANPRRQSAPSAAFSANQPGRQSARSSFFLVSQNFFGRGRQTIGKKKFKLN